ncbi:unnamed protein product [Diatraea saccharalis]|uniref:Uncharacterized protein n=1 Tax=Diatraea saccharalis TaxID=40085 RepID=A0A9N9QZZ6_9NEOP|nr:unnamed protein product [Diatraea saccharalis]
MATKKRRCLNDSNSFCVIYGEYTFAKYRKSITDFVKSAYFKYFGVHISNLQKPWVPNTVCQNCVVSSRQWSNGKRSALKFKTPMIWWEPRNHHDDCYFCMVNITGINSANRDKWSYPTLSSAQKPLTHSDQSLAPVPSTSSTSFEPENIENEEEKQDSDSDFTPSQETKPQPFNQSELNDLIRDLNLSKESSEILASRLKEKNLLTPDTKITFYRTREKDLLPYFSSEENLVYCNNVEGLIQKMGLQKYIPSEWRLLLIAAKEV